MLPYAPKVDEGSLDTFAIVHEGVTRAHGTQVLIPLPANAALYVDETYILQVPAKALGGTENDEGEGPGVLSLGEGRVLLARGAPSAKCIEVFDHLLEGDPPCRIGVFEGALFHLFPAIPFAILSTASRASPCLAWTSGSRTSASSIARAGLNSA